MFQAEEKLVSKQRKLKDGGIVMPHGDCQGLGLERQKGRGDDSLGKYFELNPGFMEPPKGFRCIHD